MKYTQRGVTLIELLVVIAVIGVLALVLLVAINPLRQLQKARDTDRKADIAQIQQALELYRSDQGTYPADGDVDCGDQLAADGVIYLRSVPCDPTNTGVFRYVYIPGSSPILQYTLRACLENASDAAGVLNGANCGTGVREYTQYNP